MRKHLKDNVVGYVALFFAIGGTTAWAVDGPLAGQNTVGSEDIIGNEVKSDDIGNGRIFNLDIADEIITGAKLKDGTITGSDVDENSLQGVVGDSVVRFDTGTADVGQRASATASCLESQVYLSGGGYRVSTLSGSAFIQPADSPTARPSPVAAGGDPSPAATGFFYSDLVPGAGTNRRVVAYAVCGIDPGAE